MSQRNGHTGKICSPFTGKGGRSWKKLWKTRDVRKVRKADRREADERHTRGI